MYEPNNQISHYFSNQLLNDRMIFCKELIGYLKTFEYRNITRSTKMGKKKMLSIPLLFLVIGGITFAGLFFIESNSPCNAFLLESMKKEDENILVQLYSKPREVKLGDSGVITVTIETAKGIKLTKYPQTSITLSGDKELTFEENTIKLGQDKMPENLMKNFLDKIQPMAFKFKVDKNVDKKMLKVSANISYFYCVAKSGFCAPGVKKIDLLIPVKKTK